MRSNVPLWCSINTLTVSQSFFSLSMSLFTFVCLYLLSQLTERKQLQYTICRVSYQTNGLVSFSVVVFHSVSLSFYVLPFAEYVSASKINHAVLILAHQHILHTIALFYIYTCVSILILVLLLQANRKIQTFNTSGCIHITYRTTINLKIISLVFIWGKPFNFVKSESELEK